MLRRGILKSIDKRSNWFKRVGGGGVGAGSAAGGSTTLCWWHTNAETQQKEAGALNLSLLPLIILYRSESLSGALASSALLFVSHLLLFRVKGISSTFFEGVMKQRKREIQMFKSLFFFKKAIMHIVVNISIESQSTASGRRKVSLCSSLYYHKMHWEFMQRQRSPLVLRLIISDWIFKVSTTLGGLTHLKCYELC